MMGALRQCFSELMSPLFVAPGRCWMLPEGLLPEGLLPEPAERQKALYGRYSFKHISPNLQDTQLRGRWDPGPTRGRGAPLHEV